MKKRSSARWLLVIAGVAGCSRAPSATKPAPAASVDKKVTEGDLVKVTLTEEAEKRLAIEIVKVEKRPMARRRTVGGEVIVPSGGTLILTAPVAATVAPTATLVKTGTTVKRGDPLVTLIPLAPVDRDLRSQAGRQSSSAEARYTAAKASLERAEKLLADGAGTAKAVEQARAEHDIAKADLDAAKGRVVTMATQPLGADVAVTIRAPHDGMVRQIGVSPGQSVAAGAILVEVVGSASLWVRVPLFPAEARRVQPDAPAKVSGFGQAEAQEALPAHAAPLADPAAGTIDLTYELSAANGLRQGERVRVDLTYLGEALQLVVPASSILRDAQGGTWIYESLGAHVFARRRVDLLGIEASSALLARGPNEGTPIVRTGSAELWGVELGAGK